MVYVKIGMSCNGTYCLSPLCVLGRGLHCVVAMLTFWLHVFIPTLNKNWKWKNASGIQNIFKYQIIWDQHCQNLNIYIYIYKIVILLWCKIISIFSVIRCFSIEVKQESENDFDIPVFIFSKTNILWGNISIFTKLKILKKWEKYQLNDSTVFVTRLKNMLKIQYIKEIPAHGQVIWIEEKPDSEQKLSGEGRNTSQFPVPWVLYSMLTSVCTQPGKFSCGVDDGVGFRKVPGFTGPAPAGTWLAVKAGS